MQLLGWLCDELFLLIIWLLLSCVGCAHFVQMQRRRRRRRRRCLPGGRARISRSSQTDPSHQREISSFLFSLQPIQLYLIPICPDAFTGGWTLEKQKCWCSRPNFCQKKARFLAFQMNIQDGDWIIWIVQKPAARIPSSKSLHKQVEKIGTQ